MGGTVMPNTNTNVYRDWLLLKLVKARQQSNDPDSGIRKDADARIAHLEESLLILDEYIASDDRSETPMENR